MWMFHLCFGSASSCQGTVPWAWRGAATSSASFRCTTRRWTCGATCWSPPAWSPGSCCSPSSREGYCSSHSPAQFVWPPGVWTPCVWPHGIWPLTSSGDPGFSTAGSWRSGVFFRCLLAASGPLCLLCCYIPELQVNILIFFMFKVPSPDFSDTVWSLKFSCWPPNISSTSL